MKNKTKTGHQYSLPDDNQYEDFMVVAPYPHSPLFKSSFIKEIVNSDEKTFVVNLDTGRLSIHQYPEVWGRLYLTRGQLIIPLPLRYADALDTLSNYSGCIIHCDELSEQFYFDAKSDSLQRLASVFSKLDLL